ncbi:CHAT domain-containing protein [Streptomyces sp. NPDC088124]|uniref:CHAT domain-containing protein n=1 Tax=Streptomyces sp. NPDC088124 TaxID=3154654 RepID=UPI00341EE9F2
MVSDEAGGGVRGLRLWAADAIRRAAPLISGTHDGTVSAGDFDGPVAELTGLRDLLDHDRELLGVVTLRLGALLAVRYTTGNGTLEDRERAQRLLNEARDPSTPSGEAVTEQDRQWAAMLLLTVTDLSVPLGTPSAAPDFWPIFDQAIKPGAGVPKEEAARLAALAEEAARLPVPPEVRKKLGQTGELLSYVSRSGLSDPRTLLDMLPADLPFTDHLRLLLELSKDMPENPETAGNPAPPASPGSPAAPASPEPAAAPTPPEPPAVSSATTPAPESDTTALGSWLTALLGPMDALRTGDPEQVSQALRRLGTNLDRLPEGHDEAPEIENLMRLMLQVGRPLGGSHQDTDVARGHARRVTEHFEQQAAADPGASGLLIGNQALNLLARVTEAEEAESGEDLAALVDELESLERSVPADHPFLPVVRLALGNALTSLGAHTRDTGTLLRGFAHQEETLASMTAASYGVPDTLFTALRDGLLTARAVVGGTPETLPGYTSPPADASAETRFLSALAATLRHSVTKDPADLDAAIGELERVRDHVRQGRSPQIAAPALWQLAENHRLRLDRTRDPADRDAATDAALESLQALAGDVVLQAGPDHGLLTARSGADRGIRAAVWAASQGRAEEAVTALELGRALVLQAASTSRAVPDLLESGGHHDLAREWRATGAAGDGEPGVLPRELPSSLRRRALVALGHRDPGGALFRTPTVEELKAGVAAGEADALVYLLAGEDTTPGMAIVVGPDTGTGVRALPLLSGEHSGPLERYVDAAARHQSLPRDATAEQEWEEALAELCDWATGAVIVPVMSGVAERLAANGERRRDRSGPPRIVLVPCGRLGIVPWHAARLPAGAPHTYACQAMVFSYAASGRQFLDTVHRARRAPAADPVLVADPSMSLPHVELEVAALHRSLYPGARLYGDLYDLPVEPEAPGTPDDLLDVLAGTPSVLHVACHGSAGTSPTASALQLAYPEDGSEAAPDGAGPGTGPDAGLLTVSRLLGRQPAGADADDGPLVVLSACQTDLSTRDHDEALTLTTAFVTSGARDVVGSRWATRDSASALMMAVFHHYVSVENRSPVDALRAAQMWMLDPHRENPGSLGSDLLDELNKGPRLNHPADWAPFIHQGHPGPATTGAFSDSGEGRQPV